jgi:ABC-type antimicrobial peptide transport system permease subunit
MIKNYFKTAWRNIWKSKGYSVINISGLAIGMAVALLISLWIYDELSFDTYHDNYSRIAQVGQRGTLNGETDTWPYLPLPLADELRNGYGSNFKYVIKSSFTESHVLAYGDKKIIERGNYMEPQAPQMFTLKMKEGNWNALKEPNSILLSSSEAKALFGNSDPVNKLMKIDNEHTVKVTGVYDDLPYNSTFAGVNFLLPWQLFIASNPWIKNEKNNWNGNYFQVYVQLADNTNFNTVSSGIKNLLDDKVDQQKSKSKQDIVLVPMSKWHLYQTFKNGVIAGGRMENVWLFGIIGFFVLLLACINFMNLITARSEKRAKEIGIRKVAGSSRKQLIKQFFVESFLVTLIAFGFSLFLVQLTLPFFNGLADKKMTLLWTNPLFWLISVLFCFLTGLIAGSYPAFYLSSFQPVTILKGTIRPGRNASIPRKVLVVLQFTVSLIMIVGTIVIFSQIRFAKNRPVGYDRDGLVMIQPNSNEIHQHFDAVKGELIKSGVVAEVAESEMPVTKVLGTAGDFSWKGKDPALAVNFPVPAVSYNYGNTVGWQFKEGRDFSKDFATDSAALVLNESAVNFMALKKPVGETIIWNGKPFRVIGVIKNMIMESPYAKARPSIFYLDAGYGLIVNIRINPAVSTHKALASIKTIFKKYNPGEPFDYKFASEEYAKKFADEERIGKLSSFFAILAIFISCLGILGLASFIAEQRTKEIGVRKVLGASVLNVWVLLSKDFIRLVLISLFIAMPLAYYFMHNWLQNYEYRTKLSWWVFAAAGSSTLIVTIVTVSFQAIKAAIANPVESLRSE